MAKGRIAKPPTFRNLDLYHQFVCEGKTQAEIAAEFEISQSRVAAVCRKVDRWARAVIAPVMEALQSQLSAENRRLNDGQILHLAIGVRRLELKLAYGTFLDQFGGIDVALAFLPLLRHWDAGDVPDTLAALLPPRHLIRSAVQMATEIDDLACLAARGPYENLPDELLKSHLARNPTPAGPVVSSPIAGPAAAPV